MKLIAISFLNLPKHDNILLRDTFPDIYYDIIKEIFENIHIYSKIKTIYIIYISDLILKGHRAIGNMKYYKLT